MSSTFKNAETESLEAGVSSTDIGLHDAVDEATAGAMTGAREELLALLRVRAAAFVQCLICRKLVPFWEVTNRHAASWECLDCADETDRILNDDEWWRVNGPKE